MTILVVGGAGYVGSVVVEEFVRGRHSVLVLDDLSTGHKDAVAPLAYLIEGSLADDAKLREACTTKDVDCVIHLAARSIVADSVADPAGYEASNVGLSVRLLDAMLAHGVRHIVFSSTAEVYDPHASMPLTERSPARPGNPYGATKLRFEGILRDRAQKGDITFVSLRYFNAAGASIDHGEDHRRETHLIPIVLDAARGARGPVPVYGTDYGTPDGTAVRDYIHVLDLADAHVRAVRHLTEGGESLVLNLGSERGASVREVIDRAQGVTGRAVPTADSPRREGDPPVLIASSQEARRVLGWTPRFAGLDVILETAWTWRQRYPEGYAE